MKIFSFIPIFAFMSLVSFPAQALVAGGCGTACMTGGGLATSFDLTFYLWRQALVIAAFYGFGYILGRFVQRKALSASLSRKTICLLTFAVSYANSFFTPAYDMAVTAGLVALGGAMIVLMLASLALPVRKRLPAFSAVFASISRPEDEPYTLPWLATEAIATTLVILIFLPVIDYFFDHILADRNVFYAMMLIPIFASGVGDALAEIVGKRWGRHHYTTRSIFGNRIYARSLEGSAMVFSTTLAVALIVAASFNFHLPDFFWKAFILLPITLTLAEAKAPHTWDNPLMYFVGYLTIIFCLWS
ncbi:MAG TPA: hypothetical protein VIF12_02550 [Micavibrio sp.]|jgi:phytol kinase